MEKLQPALRAYLQHLREEAFIDIKPGYVDTGASPNQTKPVETTAKDAGAKEPGRAGTFRSGTFKCTRNGWQGTMKGIFHCEITVVPTKITSTFVGSSAHLNEKNLLRAPVSAWLALALNKKIFESYQLIVFY